MSLLSDYLQKVRTIRAVQSTGELSFYSALEDLFNAVGDDQTPPVRCVMNLKDIGAGLPDGGLFTADQIPESTVPLFEKEMEAPPPARGAIEAKSPERSLDDLQYDEQVGRYLNRYGTVLITNLRAFRLLAEGNGDGPTVLERFTLAETPEGFWELAGNADAVPEDREKRFAEYLRRVMTHGAPLAHPEDVARLLASYAQDAKLRLGDSTLGELSQLREAIETALGVTFQGERGERFFRSTIIQTLFYGVFSAWVLWHRNDPTRTDAFDWERTARLLRVPVLQTLFHQLTAPGNLEDLRLKELLDWTGDAMNRIDRPAFFERFSEEEAVQYFYEPFLEAFDPELREELGVWYTPSEIVEYQVRRIDTVLQEELGISAGLADDRVKILDPCCGTGAYLVETLNVLEERFREQGEGDLAPAMVKEAATSRIYGFEILTAPFVVSHLQLGLTLADPGAPLEEDERAGVYLTNALTGWEPPDEPQEILFPSLQKEREEADAIKQEEDILVIFGNPPYDGYAGVAPEESEERELSNAYRESPEGVPEPEGQGLNNPYVRFFRMAERQITEYTDRGIVCYITNYSWLDGRSHSGMRARYLNDFDRIWIDNLHGDRIISERNPEGESSQTVFAMQGKSPGIRNGTAVSLLCRHETSQDNCLVRYRDFLRPGPQNDEQPSSKACRRKTETKTTSSWTRIPNLPFPSSLARPPPTTSTGRSFPISSRATFPA
jgi:SAM-dependent methyltransferase